MIITKKEYNGFIKPLVDKCVSVGKSLNEPEFLIAGNKLLKIVENEFNPTSLLETLNSLSSLSIEICKKYELYPLIENAISFLNLKKSS